MEFLLLAAIIGLIPAYIAYKKGRSFFLWWFFGLLLWIVAMPCALLMKSDPYGVAKIEGLIQCEYCAEWVKKEALICKYCKTEIKREK